MNHQRRTQFRGENKEAALNRDSRRDLGKNFVNEFAYWIRRATILVAEVLLNNSPVYSEITK